jgi:UDPglucose--hexose-1-phosphate uridylyltransferase
MPILRQDASTKEWVIMATERAKRPHEFAQARAEKGNEEAVKSCPFCPGSEDRTPPEVLAFRKDGTPNGAGWSVRVIPNKFAALVPGRSAQRRHDLDFFPSMDGVGVHEVIIESPAHDRPLPLLDEGQVAEVLFAYRARFQQLRQDGPVKAIVIFKNHGERAGTSLAHPHSQLVATPIVPRDIRLRHGVAREYYDDTGDCIYCVMLHKEMEASERIVEVTHHFAAFHPFASRTPFETWILPRHHNSSFGDADDDEIYDFAALLRQQLRKLYYALNDPDYNFIIHTAPLEDEDKEYYLWHLQILPRLTTIAGFELGSGIYINTVLPEETAAFIREARAV